MKNVTRYAVAAVTMLLASQAATAQTLPVTNGSFESWSPQTYQTITGPVTIQEPNNWDLGFFTSFLIAFGQPARFDKSTTAHTGTGSLRITPDSIGADLICQMPVSRSYFGMRGWVRGNALSNDTAQTGFMFVIMTKSQPGGGHDTVAIGSADLVVTQPNTWERFEGPIVQIDPQTPDSALVWVGATEASSTSFQMLIDDLELTVNPPMGTAHEQAAPVALSLAPNPVRADAQTFVTVPARSAGRAALTITDVLGRTAGRVRMHNLVAGDNRLPVPTHGLPAGTYQVQVLTAEGTRQSRLVIE